MDIDGAIILGEQRKRRIVPVVAFLVPMIVVVASAAWFVRAFVAPPTIDIPAPSLMSAEAASAAASLAASRQAETLGARSVDAAPPAGSGSAARPASSPALTEEPIPTLSSWVSSPSGRSAQERSSAVPMVATLSFVPPAASLTNPDAVAPPTQARASAQAPAQVQAAVAPVQAATPAQPVEAAAPIAVAAPAQAAAPAPPAQVQGAAPPAPNAAPRQTVASSDPFAAIVDDWNKPGASTADAVPLPPQRPRVTAAVQGPVPLPRPRPRAEPVPENRPPDNPFSFLFR